jgi:hypothetical protein
LSRLPISFSLPLASTSEKLIKHQDEVPVVQRGRVLSDLETAEQLLEARRHP